MEALLLQHKARRRPGVWCDHGWEGFVTEHQHGIQTLPLTNQASPSHPLCLGCFSREVT